MIRRPATDREGRYPSFVFLLQSPKSLYDITKINKLWTLLYQMLFF